MNYHASHRGPQILTFIEPPSNTTTPYGIPPHDGVITRRFKDYAVPSDRVTTYACQSMQFDFAGADKHVIAIHPLVNPASTHTNHHAILHVCTGNDFYDQHLTPKPCSQNLGDEGQSPLGELNSG